MIWLTLQFTKSKGNSPTFSTDRNQPHTFTGDVIQRFIHIGYFVKSHLASVWFRELFTGYDLQEKH